MVAKKWPPENTGDPTKTPFVYYVSGVPVFPPNNVRETALGVLKADNSKNLTDRLKSRAKHGLIGGTVAILPETWWNQFFLNYVGYFGNNFSKPQELEEHAATVLEIIAASSSEEAWKKLVEFIIQEIDTLSGWTKSWTRELAERHNVFWGDDGNYYCRDLDGTLIHVMGEKALPETHLDFVSDHVLRGWGCIRQILNVFSTFAISDDYSKEPTGFPQSMKAVVNQTHHDTSHRWLWEHREAIVKEEGVGGPKRPLPHIWAPRLNIGHRIEPQYLPLDTSNFSQDRWLALALYKEGANSKSTATKDWLLKML